MIVIWIFFHVKAQGPLGFVPWRFLNLLCIVIHACLEYPISHCGPVIMYHAAQNVWEGNSLKPNKRRSMSAQDSCTCLFYDGPG